jgi:hypothetical protein
VEVFAYWNAETLKRVFDAIVMVIGGGGWSNILKSVAIIGLLLSVTIGLLRIQAQHSLGYLLFLAIWYFGLLLPTTSVIIVNRAGPSASPTYTVANVPLGLAFFASVTSSVGDWLTTRYETMFAMPADLQFQRNGLMFGSRLVRTGIEQARIEDPGVNADFMAFMKDCVHPELFDSPTVFSDFLKSTDIVATLDGMALNPARVALIANTSNTGLEAVPCTTAWNRLKGKLAAQATAARDRLSQLFFPGFSSADKATQIDASLVAADTVMLSVARTSLESVRQKMMINMVRDSNVSIATAINNPTLAQTALAQAMAEQSANTAYRVMAKIGEETLPLVRNAIEVVIYAIFPIIMLLIVGAGAMGGKVLGAYVLGMVWLQMWPALFAIVNSLTHERVADVMQGVAPGGESIATATALTSAGLGPEAIAGMLTLSIPLIAWAIVKGGEVAMSGVATGVMGPASASAQRAGDAVGVGNVAAGNVSWGGTSMNNASANSFDTRPRFADGSSGAITTDGVTGTFNSKGWTGADASGFGFKGPVAVAGQRAAAFQSAQEYSSAVSSLQSTATAYSASLEGIRSRSEGARGSTTEAWSVGGSWGSSDSTGVSRSAQDSGSWLLSQRYAEGGEQSKSNQTATAYGARVGVGGGSGGAGQPAGDPTGGAALGSLLSALPVSGSASLQNNDIKADSAKTSAERGEAAQRTLAAQHALSEDNAYLSNRLASITNGRSTERYRGEAADLRAALALNQKAGAELQQVSSAAEKLSRATSAGATSSLDGLADSARFYLKATGTDGVALMMSTQQGAEAFAAPAMAEQTSAAAAAQPAAASFDASGGAQRSEFAGNRANLTNAAAGPAGVANVYAGAVNPSQAAANGFNLPGDGAGHAGNASGIPGFSGRISAPAAPGGQQIESWVRDQQAATVTEQGNAQAGLTAASTRVTDARGEVGREAADRITQAREGARATPTPTPEER